MTQPTGRQPPNRPAAGKPSGTEQGKPQTGKTVGENTSPAVAGAELQKGYVIGQYRIIAKLGQGGMGAVYRAEHIYLQTPVALKILPADRLQNPELLARFHREIQAAGRIDHPNLVRALDAGQVGSIHYLAMEFVDGRDLAKIVKTVGPLPIPEACEIIRQAALGVQAIANQGMVHRDIKPSNLMLARQPAGPPIVKILDLGLARLADLQGSGEQLTQSHVIVGTIEYMAPEQAAHRQVDVRTDIYSLGATFYALLAGRPPFSGPQYDSLLSKLRALAVEEPPPIQNFRPDIPDELAAILERMLAKDPEARFSSPLEVASALEPLCQGANLAALLEGKLPKRAATVVSSESSAQPLREPSSPEPVSLRRLSQSANWQAPVIVAAIVAPLFVLFLVIVVWQVWLARPSADSPSPSQQALRTTQPASRPIAVGQATQSSTRPRFQSSTRATSTPRASKPSGQPSPPIRGDTQPTDSDSRTGTDDKPPSSQPPSSGKPEDPGPNPGLPPEKPQETPPEPAGRVVRTWRVGQDVATLPEAVARASRHDIIVLPAGKQELLDSLIIAKPLTIRGAGREKTSIVSAAPMCVLRFMGAGPWTLESLTCEHSGKNSASVVIVDSGQFTAKDCAFVGGFRSAPEKFGGYGLDILHADSAILSQCLVERNESIGICLRGKEDGQYLLEECIIRECKPGVSWERGKGRILKCTVEKCRDSGIIVMGTAVVEIQGCLVRANAQHGIVFFHNTQGTVKNCQTHGNGHHGIAVYENALVDTEGNTCTGNGQYGIEYFGDTKGLCRKNNCTLNLCGIGLGMNTTAVAEGNICRQNKLDGIWIRESAQPVVRGNNCSVNGGSGIRTQDVSKPTLSGNQCLGNKYWGINITDSAAPQIGRDNTLVGNGYGPISRRP